MNFPTKRKIRPRIWWLFLAKRYIWRPIGFVREPDGQPPQLCPSFSPTCLVCTAGGVAHTYRHDGQFRRFGQKLKNSAIGGNDPNALCKKIPSIALLVGENTDHREILSTAQVKGMLCSIRFLLRLPSQIAILLLPMQVYSQSWTAMDSVCRMYLSLIHI